MKQQHAVFEDLIRNFVNTLQIPNQVRYDTEL